MPNAYKRILVREMENRWGRLTRLPNSQSLVQLQNETRIYLRYSKIHQKGVAFFGLRQVDLNVLDGHNSYICFFTDSESPLFIPYSDFESVFRQSPLASDGQYKVQIAYGASTRELYLPRVGHFNVDAYGGTESLNIEPDAVRKNRCAILSHIQVQTLLGGIGILKGYGVYVPPNNADLLDWTLTPSFRPLSALPKYIEERSRFASEIDVIWVDYKENLIAAAFEVEHSTPVYSGLLRFNDVLLTCPKANRFFVVSNESRRDLFVRQIQRPTFQRSGLAEMASFLDYCNVYDWYHRLENS